VGVARADCRRLPFADASVDVVLCDLPYGRQYGTEVGNQKLYAEALREVARVLRPGTGRAVLITTATDANNSGMAVAIKCSRLQLVRAPGFQWGGHKDRIRCTLYCLVRPYEGTCTGKSLEGVRVASEDLFDWSCLGLPGESGAVVDEDFVWKGHKPLLQLYTPWAEAGGQARELVRPVSVRGISSGGVGTGAINAAIATPSAARFFTPAVESVDELAIALGQLTRRASRQLPRKRQV